MVYKAFEGDWHYSRFQLILITMFDINYYSSVNIII